MSTCATRPVLMDYDGLMRWVLRKLGAPRWNIELHPCQLNDAIEDAIQWYVSWRGARKNELKVMLTGKVDYPYPEDADTILDVVPPDTPHNFGMEWSLAPYAGNFIPNADYRGVSNAGGPFSAFAQSEQFQSMASRVVSADFNWRVNHHERLIIISPIPRRTGPMMIVYKSGCFNMADLSAYEHTLLKRYALAEAKETLALIRRRFPRVPGADGDQTLDGAELMDEARSEKEKLDEDIRLSAYPMTIVLG